MSHFRVFGPSGASGPQRFLDFFSTLLKSHILHRLMRFSENRMQPHGKNFSKCDFHEIDDVIAQNSEKFSAKV